MDSEVIEVLREIRDEVKAGFEQTNGRLDETNGRLDETNARLEGLEKRVGGVEERLEKGLARVDERFDSVGRTLNNVSARVDVANMRLEQLEGKVEGVKARLLLVEGSLQGVEEGVTGGFKRVTESIAELRADVKATLDDHEVRITKLEKRSA